MMARENSYTVTSLFCGAGGLDLGFHYAGFNVVWANDISENAVKSYHLNLKVKPICKNIREYPIDEIPTTDLIIGGPPCQAFSLVGKRSPDDQRGHLVFYYLDIIKHKRPRAFVMENVPGLAASRINKIRLTDMLVDEFKKIGYYVNVIKPYATEYLVPQRRKRIFILGSRESFIQKPNPSLFAKECYNLDIRLFDLSANAAIGDLGPCVPKGEFAHYRSNSNSQYSKLMRRVGVNKFSLHECPRMSETDKELVKHIPPGGNYMDIPDDIAPGRVLKFKKSGGRTTTYGKLHPDRPAYTINTYFRRPNVGCNFHYNEPRLITAREAMRFQSFPDWFELSYNSQDERNSFIGNAVPPLFAHAIAWSVCKSFGGNDTT